jgi:hypothetical protein
MLSYSASHHKAKQQAKQSLIATAYQTPYHACVHIDKHNPFAALIGRDKLSTFATVRASKHTQLLSKAPYLGSSVLAKM